MTKKLPKPTPMMALDGLKMVLGAVQENHRISETEQTKRHEITAFKETELERIRSQRDVMKDYFERIFSEREKNFDNLFKAFDKGIESNNSQVIEQSLSTIIQIAEDSPLKQIKKLKSDLNNPDIKHIEI